ITHHKSGDMRKIIILALLFYITAHTIYFIYSLMHVSYTRRQFSKRDLSDGPLVLKEGVVAKKGKVIPLTKKSKKKASKHSAHVRGPKTNSHSDGKNSILLSKTVISPKVDRNHSLHHGFVKKFTEEAKLMSQSRKLIYFTVVNGAFEKMTLNWLCNVAAFKGSQELMLIVSTSKALCDKVHREYGQKVHCIFADLPGYEEDLDWGEQKYIDFLVVRLQLMKALVESSVRFVLIETDSTWFRDPMELFLNATMIDDADIVTPIKGTTHAGDSLAFSPMLVEPTNTSVVLFKEINRRISDNTSLYDQDVLNELCSIQHHGVVCRNFEYNEIADGKWYYLSDEDKGLMQPYIVNNNFYVGLKNKEARQAISGLWFLTRSGRCSVEKVERARKRFLGLR
uniref:Nucleotid_trans domain-containing protein n=1 Tax=Haemonchus contortus TaxID=6289 RepID=A0A7I4Y8C0_HAECO